MTTMTKKIGIQFIIGVMVGFMLNANHNKGRNVVSYDKYLICPAVIDSPFGQPKCNISNEMYIAYYFGHFLRILNKLIYALSAYLVTKKIYERRIRDEDFWFGMTYGIIYSMIDD